MTERIRTELARIAEELGGDGVEFVVERPRDPTHGDLATNLAMVLARRLRRRPRELAEAVVERLRLPAELASKTEIAGPGFINFWLADTALTEQIQEIVSLGSRYGRNTLGSGRSVNIEFVSANPTGPLHVGHGRGAAVGDVLASLLEWSGYRVVREFYVNDAGAQIDKLAESLWARVQQAVGRDVVVPEGGYFGAYLVENAEQILEEEGAAFADLPMEEGLARCRAMGVALQRSDQDQDLRTFGVHFDVITSERSLYDHRKVEAAIDQLTAGGLTFEADGALWLRTERYGDDKPRVLRKRDGTYTYLVPDIAYHIDKHERGFTHVIDVWGADHHGYIPRMRAVLQALGYPDDFFDVTLVQLVKVVRGGEEVKMSKRTGTFVTLRDLVEEVGVDAARYFFLMRRADSQFAFDVDLAKRHTDENPIFYVQMAHARLSGIFRVADCNPDDVVGTVALEDLPAPHDVDLLKKLTIFPDVVARAAEEREPHRVPVYVEELARLVHGWYHHCRVLGEPPGVERARLMLARAARIVVANALAVLGITAPDRM
ncbi:MAG TPA: arginine--tRNA ligase [Gemmatimonadales bacterium]|nr:arginine--tRNA ligase [Gemmatimonadales bacterium]